MLVLFVELVAYWFWSWILLFDDFSQLTTGKTIRKISCIKIFLSKKPLHWFFSSCNWFLFMEWLPCWYLFVEHVAYWLLKVSTWNFLCVHISLRETCTLTFLFVQLILFMELVFCRTSLVKLAWWNLVYWFSFTNLAVCWFFLPETFTLIFCSLDWFCSRNLVLADFFVKLVVCWISFARLIACWFFSWWKLYINFSPRETGLAHWSCFFLILLMKLVVCWILSSRNILM